VDEEDRAAAGTEHPYLSGERLQCAVKIGCPYSLLMSRDFDYRAEAKEAMREAAAATTAVERIKWVRLALAWQDLARGGEGQDGMARWVTR